MTTSLQYKIVLVGDGGVGKSTFLKRQLTGEFERKYIATQGVDVSSLVFNTNYGILTFKVWDCAGQEKFRNVMGEYCRNAEGVIAMYDLTSRVSSTNVSYWITHVRTLVANVPVVICGNKHDIQDRKVNGWIEAQNLPNVIHYCVSAKNNHNFEKPFLDLARRLTGHEDLKFIDKPAVTLPEVNIPITQMSVQTPMQTEKNVSWIDVPGGVMRITTTCEYYIKV
jgi:GTP-binding nuclear protein Ran